MAYTNYIGVAPTAKVDVTNRVTYIAAANQTAFAATYTPGYVDVYQNGLKLQGPSGIDFTAVDGATVVLNVPCVLGDTIDIEGTKASSPYDVYTKAMADARAGNFYAIAVGTSDSLSITANPLPAAMADGMEIKVRVASSNLTTTPTVTISNLGVVYNITCLGGQVLPVGAWVPNQEITLRYNLAGTRFEFVGFSQSLGLGQTWQNVVGSRAAGTTYTNSTGRPIFVNVGMISNLTTQTLFVTINGMAAYLGSTAPNAGNQTSASFIVPAGGTYSAIVSGTPTVTNWYELR